MNCLPSQIEAKQKALCSQFEAEYVATLGDAKSGFALSTKGMNPINGLRNPPVCGTSGWYIWCGEHFSEAGDFFAPLHTQHLYEDYPEITRLLGLAPGYRFLLAGDYLDVWYDPSLLNVSV
jgi:hypothetical protein